ncbi:hypothetical protein T4B_10731 [Trichinella pseudospiralis]|uniref:Uncharacterized protein n=1 Tax=Trichinella pseudospiralis TaxID=6337 RepID=A0A0V1JH84_TRIPS|nr:hypothetical protein T4B_10731 [Trichinella pseudospiralis]
MYDFENEKLRAKHPAATAAAAASASASAATTSRTTAENSKLYNNSNMQIGTKLNACIDQLQNLFII